MGFTAFAFGAATGVAFSAILAAFYAIILEIDANLGLSNTLFTGSRGFFFIDLFNAAFNLSLALYNLALFSSSNFYFSALILASSAAFSAASLSALACYSAAI